MAPVSMTVVTPRPSSLSSPPHGLPSVASNCRRASVRAERAVPAPPAPTPPPPRPPRPPRRSAVACDAGAHYRQTQPALAA